MKRAKFYVSPTELSLPFFSGYDITVFTDGKCLAEYFNVPESELDTALVEFQALHGKHDMIQVLPSGEERVIG